MLRGGARARLLARLSLPASADESAVKAKYRELAKVHHPDHNPGCATSAERFAQITDAYQRLIGSEGEGADAASEVVDPAMQARWNIRRRAPPSEYPAWFKPDDDAAPKDGAG